jgi:hypothetical protein
MQLTTHQIKLITRSLVVATERGSEWEDTLAPVINWLDARLTHSEVIHLEYVDAEGVHD